MIEACADLPLSGRAALAAVSACLLGLVAGAPLAAALRAWRDARRHPERPALAPDPARRAPPTTLGGLLIVAPTLFVTLAFARLDAVFVVAGLVVMILLGAVGALDDLSILLGRRIAGAEGARRLGFVLAGLALGVAEQEHRLPAEGVAGAAFVGQGDMSGAGARLAVAMGLEGPHEPFAGLLLAAGGVALAALLLWMVARAVRSADGVDGVAMGSALPCLGGFVAVALLASGPCAGTSAEASLARESAEVAVLGAAAAGATLALLRFELPRARIYPGATGSYAIAAIVTTLAIATGRVALLPAVGAVFALEWISVLVQLGAIRILGRRLLRCAPLHNHLLLCGWRESMVRRACYGVGVLLAVGVLAAVGAG